jgi:hypothetical protein
MSDASYIAHLIEQFRMTLGRLTHCAEGHGCLRMPSSQFTLGSAEIIDLDTT